MSDLTELFAVNSGQVLDFFLEHLEEYRIVSKMDHEETLYVARILARYAQISRSDENIATPAASLEDILNNFILKKRTTAGTVILQNPYMLEIAGSQTLILVGFLRDQLKGTYNLEWYDNLGSTFFAKASCLTKKKGKAKLLGQVAEHFPIWAYSCNSVNRAIRDEQQSLKLDIN
jgi:hypothetical protein